MPSDFHGFVNVLKTNVEIQSYKYIEDVAEQIVEEAISILETQRYKWKPLNTSYLNWKADNGLDTRILIATGFYQDHISWGRKPNGNIWVGVEDVWHPTANMSLVKLARIHEYGTADIPARPLWRPLLSKYIRQSDQLANRYRKEVALAGMKARRENLTRRKVKINR